MISDLFQLNATPVCERAEAQAAVMEHEAQIRAYQAALTQPRALQDVHWAKTLRKAIKVAHYSILELEAA